MKRFTHPVLYKRCVAAAAVCVSLSLPASALGAYATLQKGDKGEAVFRLEEAMALQGYFDAMPDQVYDDATVVGVKGFQEANNLTADGIAGDKTQTLLFGMLSGDEAAQDTATGAVVTSTVNMPSTLRDLSLNKKGNDVSSLQSRLTELGYYTGRVSGTYGKLTQTAVKAFQSANGLKADGIAGVNTQTKMYAPTAVAATGTAGTAANTPVISDTAAIRYQTLKAHESSGDAVLAMQTKLKELGYYTGSLTGSFGNLTWEAVRKFQKANGLTADGVAGQKTLEKLYATAPPSGTTTPGTTTPDTTVPVVPETPAAGTDSTTLQSGMSGDAVLAMQTKLKELGYYGGPLTGNFGNVTWEALRKFQKAKGLTADGIAGPKTLEKLYATSSPSTGNDAATQPETPAAGGALKFGSRGEDVKSLQQSLKSLGYLSGKADGVFGTATQVALQAFQKANGLTADGIAGVKTLNRIQSSSAVAAPGTAGTTGSVTNKTLKYGMKGETAVKDMQTQLTKLGYYSGSITGNFGDLTLKAVKAFQSANGLTADGIAGTNTLTRMYSGTAIAKGSGTGGTGSGNGSTGTPANRPNPANVQNVNWYTYIRPRYKAGTVMQVYDFENDLTWQCVMMSNGKHADSQPRTAEDTEIMYRAFGNKNTWTPKAVWITMPDGNVYMASLHNMPHLSGSIKDNNFDGHLCVHFPREMKEAEDTGPYAVSHQKAIIKGWEKTQAMIGR